MGGSLGGSLSGDLQKRRVARNALCFDDILNIDVHLDLLGRFRSSELGVSLENEREVRI